jgi:elongation factor 1 alpha-like protein
VLDESDKERERGLTIDVNVKNIETPNNFINLLDVPGHRDFLPKMIEGTINVNAALLICPATNEFESAMGSGENIDMEGSNVNISMNKNANLNVNLKGNANVTNIKGQVGTNNYSGVGQLREHAIIAKSMGIPNIIIVVNKMDDQNIHWSFERFQHIKTKMIDFLKSLDYKEEQIQVIPVSGLRGDNLTERIPTTLTKEDAISLSDQSLSPSAVLEKQMSWYKGPTLLDILDSLSPPTYKNDLPFKFFIQSLKKNYSSDIILNGRIENGMISMLKSKENEKDANNTTNKLKLLLCPYNEVIEIKSIENLNISLKHQTNTNSITNTHSNPNPNTAKPDMSNPSNSNKLPNVDLTSLSKIGRSGDMIDIHINHRELRPELLDQLEGCWLVERDCPLQVVSKLRLQVLSLSYKIPIITGTSLMLYAMGTSEPINVKSLISIYDENLHKNVEKPRILPRNCKAIIDIECKKAICMDTYQNCPEMGRIVLRRDRETVAVGIVIGLFK